MTNDEEEEFADWLKVCEKYQREEDKARHDAMNEGTIQQHFFGKFDLKAELMDCGIMQPEGTCAQWR